MADEITVSQFTRLCVSVEQMTLEVKELTQTLRGNGKPGLIRDMDDLKDWRERHDKCEDEKKATAKSVILPVVTKLFEYGVFGAIAWAVVNIQHKP